ncbi:uncharacterized protein LOC116264819 [Nymphaea colorata]|nr:uncharacterized protein LOC116264819 [Nymphaea colorata]
MANSPVKYAMVDAFTDVPFKGNPAVVCVLEEERDGHWMQEAAKEFGICVTAFVRPASRECTPPENGDAIFHLRWFTPVTELGICGHATLATSHHLFSSGIVAGTRIKFLTNSGPITADKIEGSLSAAGVTSAGGAKDEFCIELDLPRFTVHDCDPAPYMSLFSETLNGVQIKGTKKVSCTEDLIVEIDSGDAVRELQPRMDELRKWPGRAVVVTAIASPDSGFDFISRFFGPKIGIDEDHVCASTHCGLAPYWSSKLGKCKFIAYMASKRGGQLAIQLKEETGRVLIRGQAVTTMVGSLLV